MIKNQSITINYLRFILILAIITLHAYTTTQTVDWLREGYPMYQFFSYNLSLLFGNIGVPFFFFISGYFFFIKGKPDYFQKLKSRFHSLVIPYILWNFSTIILYYIAQHFIYTEGLFSGYHKAIAEYSFGDFLRAFWDSGDWNLGNGTPILTTYWYIRNLIVFTIVSPVVYVLNKYLKFYWLIVVGLVWLTTPHVAFTSCSIFCLGIGAYFGMYRIRILLDPCIFKVFFVIMIGLVILLNFFLYYPVEHILSVMSLRLFIICAIPVIYTVVYHRVEKGQWKISQKWLDSAFFVYSFHAFLILALRKAEMKLFPGASDGLSVFFYLSSVVITFFVSYGVYALLRKYVPKMLAVMCGDRC